MGDLGGILGWLGLHDARCRDASRAYLRRSMDGDFLTIGFDLGGTKMHAAAVDGTGQVLRSEREKTLASEGADAVIKRMIETVTRLRDHLERGPVRALCVGVPGAVDEKYGVVHDAPNLGWHD